MKRKWTRCFSVLLLCGVLAGIWPARAAAVSFRDVPAGHWAGEAISRCAEKGFFQGRTADTFGLGESMTRSAAVVVLDRFFGWEDAQTVLPYDDVPADAWYAGALRAAYANGAVTAQSRSFRPGDPITREELAVMLIRALGYGEISGIAQELPQTFTDVRTNLGYIAMARDFGLVSGIRPDTFAADRYATREQVAVILMRLYDKLQRQQNSTLEIVNSAEEMAGMGAVAVSAAMLLGSGRVKETCDASVPAAVREKAGERDVLLYVSAMNGFLEKYSDEAVENLTAAVENGGYDGLVLEMRSLPENDRVHLTRFVADLYPALGERILLLVVPLPGYGADLAAGSYDYTSLCRTTDGLILKFEPDMRLVDGFPVVPPVTLENVYWGLAQLKNNGADGEKLRVLLPTEGLYYRGRSEQTPLTGEKLRDAVENGRWMQRYSQRYGCAYLEKAQSDEAVWYLDGQAAEAQVQMLNLLGAGGVCVEAPAEGLPEVLDRIQ